MNFTNIATELMYIYITVNSIVVLFFLLHQIQRVLNRFHYHRRDIENIEEAVYDMKRTLEKITHPEKFTDQ